MLSSVEHLKISFVLFASCIQYSSEMPFPVDKENTEIRNSHYSVPVFLHGACYAGLGRDKQWRSGLVQTWDVFDDVSFAV